MRSKVSAPFLSPTPLAASRSTLFACLLFAACGKQGQDDSNGLERTTSGSGSGSAAGSAPPDDGAPADAIPIALTANLRCSSTTATTFTRDANAAETTLACFLTGADGTLFVVQSLKLRVKGPAGEFEPPTVTKDVAESPWQIGVLLTAEQLAQLSGITAEVVTSDGSVGTVATADAAYDWMQDPLFKSLYETAAVILAIGNPPEVFDRYAQIAGFRDEVRPFHLLFASSRVFDGAITVAGADAVCAEAGAALLPRARWQALLGTKERSAAQRVRLSGPVLNYAGGTVASTPEEFWAGAWTTSAAYTETGANVVSEFVGVLDGFVKRAWFGADVGGAIDPEGRTCGDWTDAIQGSGRVLDLEGFGTQQTGFPATLRPCARAQRLACISRDATIPVDAAQEITLSFAFKGIDWRLDAWTTCSGALNAQRCDISNMISYQGQVKPDPTLDVTAACGKKVARDFAMTWTERSATDGAIEIIAIDADTKAPLRLVFDTTDPRWVCAVP